MGSIKGKENEPVLYYKPVPFTPKKYWKSQGSHKTFLILWLFLCVFIIPSGMLTRIFELTGIPLTLFGTPFHITIYIPMILCVPLCLIFGYFWAAIPAYFSTFFVALLGDMPLHWVFVFSFANPIGLAVLVMIYRLTTMRIDMRSASSATFFIFVSFLSAISGSVGSFIWTYTNQVNLHDFFRVWQGWWIGGFLQSVLICLPLIYLITPYLISFRNQLTHNADKIQETRSQVKFAITVVIMVVTLYIWIAFQINFMNVEDKLTVLQNSEAKTEVINAIDVFHFPLYIFLFIIMIMGYFFFYFTDQWHLRLQKINDELTKKNIQMYRDSIHDQLTGAYNRNFLFDSLESEIQKHFEKQRPLSFIMLDLDFFKSINDQYGHQGGDEVLKQFSQTINQNIQSNHIFARFGGEEFSMILIDTNLDEAEETAKKIIQLCNKDVVIIDGSKVRYTTSIGISCLEKNDSLDTLVARADRALYKAKEKGRNTYQIA